MYLNILLYLLMLLKIAFDKHDVPKLLCEKLIKWYLFYFYNLNLRKIKCHWIDRVCDFVISSTWEAVRIDLCIFLVSNSFLCGLGMLLLHTFLRIFLAKYQPSAIYCSSALLRPAIAGRPGCSQLELLGQ